MSYQDSPDNRCKRIGCSRRRTGQNVHRDTCGPICGYAYRQHQEAQAIAAHLGHSDPVDEYLLASRELGLAIDRANKARSTLRRLSLDAGWSSSDWDALVSGQYRPQETGTPQQAGAGLAG